MYAYSRRGSLSGEIAVPGSKSCTIRGVMFGMLAEGTTVIHNPLPSKDGLAAVAAARAFGAEVVMDEKANTWTITGLNGKPKVPENVIDTMNSGTTTSFVTGICALLTDGYAVLTGDEQIRRRPWRHETDALKELGATCIHTRPNCDCPPLVIQGPLHGGVCHLPGFNSQHISGLLGPCALLPKGESVDILVEKVFFDPKTYREQGVLTSTEIQKVWLEATKRRKRDLTTLPYLLVETEEDKPDKDKTCTQKRENCTQDADIFPENACNSKQSKESKVKESKAKESRALPPLTPPGESGGAQGNPDLDIPGYAYNRNTHNLECLMLNLEKLYITDREEIRKILKLSDYGRLGNYVWKIFNGTNWNKVNSKGGYIISVLAREKRSTGS